MSHVQQYSQCVLRRKVESGVQVETAWIPSQFAKVGKLLKLRTVPTRPDCFSGMGEYPDESQATEWVDGWVVSEVGVVKSADWLNEHSRDHLHQREASDI
jgi:hypothetical protein